MKNIEDATLDDVGQEVMGLFHEINRNITRWKIVSMIIKAPRGRMVLFKGNEPTIQAEAIRLFMQQHRKD